MSWKHPVTIFCLVTLGLYFFSFFNQFVWDDEQFIYRNAFVSNFAVKEIFTTNTVAGAGELSNYYRPLTTLSFALDYQFWGLNPFGYHVVNTLLHLSTGVLLYYFLLKLKFNQLLSFGATLIFLVHPLQTEAVTYINSRGDSLYSFFLLISLYLHTLLFDKKLLSIKIYQNTFSISKPLIFSGVLLTYLASILSKEIALAGLGLHGLVILRYFWLNFDNKKYFWKNFQEFLATNMWSIASFLGNIVTVLIYLKLRSSILNFDNTFNFYSDSSLYSESISVRLLTFLKIIFIYIRLVFVPFPLHMERNVTIISDVINPWLFAFIVLTIILVTLCYLQWKKYKRTDILFGWAWAAVMLLPVSGIIAINGLMYEHWLYLPLIGFFIMTYGIIELFNENVFKNKIAQYAFLAIVCIFGLLTLRQNYFWSSPIVLYTHLLRYTDSARIHNNLAMAYSENGQRQEALVHYKKALEYGMTYPQIYHNMGNTYRDLGDLQNAEVSYQKALEISPEFYHTYTNLVRVYAQQKKYTEAIEVTKLAQQHYPDAPKYHLLELEILLLSGNDSAFETKKTFIIENFSSDPQISEYIQTLQFSQE